MKYLPSVKYLFEILVVIDGFFREKDISRNYWGLMCVLLRAMRYNLLSFCLSNILLYNYYIYILINTYI